MPQDRIIKYFAPSSEKWKPITPEGEDDEAADIAKKNRSALNEVLLSSMQMQNLVVLSGCGTSLGTGGGPSMWNLWELCTKDEDEEYTDEASTGSLKNSCRGAAVCFSTAPTIHDWAIDSGTHIHR